MVFPKHMTYPSSDHGAPSGTPEFDTDRLGGNTLEDVIKPLDLNIKIDRTEIIAAIPTLTEDDLTQSFMLKFVSGGMPLVLGPTNEYIFNATALKTPDKVIANRGLGMSGNNQQLLTYIEDDGVSFYVKSSSSGKDRIVLLGKQSRFKMQVDYVPLNPATYSKGIDKGSAPFPLPTDADLEKDYTVTGDYPLYKGVSVKDNSLLKGDTVNFKFVLDEGVQKWVVVKAATEADGNCQVRTMSATIDTTGKPLEAFGDVSIRFK